MLHMNTVDTLQMPLAVLQGYLKINNLGLYVHNIILSMQGGKKKENLDNTTAGGKILPRPFGLNGDNDEIFSPHINFKLLSP